MSKESTLIIPDRIKVGYQNRADTYQGKLAYVIYFDAKGTLRKEKSWESWRHKDIEPQEFINEPTEGFVLNKSGGGQRHSYGWNVRNEFIRVYDPRNFEFEISLPNLLFILRETDCSRGKGLEGKFVYAWDGTQLILLPVGSADYTNSKAFTELQTKGIKAKELVPGHTYGTKQQEDLLFLGKFDYHFLAPHENWRRKKGDETGVCKRLVFWHLKNGRRVYLQDPKSLAVLKSDAMHPDFAKLVTEYGQSPHGSKVVALFLKEVPEEVSPSGYRSECWYYEPFPGLFAQMYSCSNHHVGITGGTVDYIQGSQAFTLKNGVFTSESYGFLAYPPNTKLPYYHHAHQNRSAWVEPTQLRLFARTENGLEFNINKHSFNKE